MAWTITDATPADPTVPAVLALEDGPLAPLDVATIGAAAIAPTLTPVVTDALGGVDALHQVIDDAHMTATEASDPTPFDTEAGGAIAEGTDQATAHGIAVDLVDVGELVDRANSNSTTAGNNVGNYDETPPPDVAQTDPGPPPDQDQSTPPQV